VLEDELVERPTNPDHQVHIYRLQRVTRTPLLVLSGILVVGAAAIAAVPIALPLLDPRLRTPVALPILALVAVLALLLLAAALFTLRLGSTVRLEVGPTGIAYYQVGYTLRSTWENVVRIQPIAFGEALVLRTSGLANHGRMARMARLNRQDYLIPLTPFGWWWRDAELGRDLLTYAPHLFQPEAMRPGPH
jgi:hypothetical protein